MCSEGGILKIEHFEKVVQERFSSNAEHRRKKNVIFAYIIYVSKTKRQRV